jgi:hypothetical protein
MEENEKLFLPLQHLMVIQDCTSITASLTWSGGNSLKGDLEEVSLLLRKAKPLENKCPLSLEDCNKHYSILELSKPLYIGKLNHCSLLSR